MMACGEPSVRMGLMIGRHWSCVGIWDFRMYLGILIQTLQIAKRLKINASVVKSVEKLNFAEILLA